MADSQSPGTDAPRDGSVQNPQADAGTETTDAQPTDAQPAMQSNEVRFETSMGVFVVELNSEAAPNTVSNFLSYVDSGFYDGSDGMEPTTFHRIISGFMVQGGGILANGRRKTTAAPIAHESPNGLNNLRGTIAMARTNAPDSATSQFFINLVDNDFLDYGSPQEPGYVVFGRVIEGMDVVDEMAAVQTNGQDAPLSTIVIEAAARR